MAETEKVVIKITNISNYTYWYKNDLNKQYFVDKCEGGFQTIVKGKTFFVPESDCEVIPQTPKQNE